MEGGVSIKGTGFLPAVVALKAEREKLEPLLPERLKHYVDLTVDLTDWYPVSDFVELIRIIARGLMPDVPAQRAIEYFGQAAAERDLLGSQRMVPVGQRDGRAGLYEGAISKKHDLATTLRRICGLYQLYYDAGEMTVRRSGERALRFRHEGYPMTSPELCYITVGYMRQILKMTGIEGKFEQMTCRALGDPECELHFFIPDDADASALAAFER